MCTCHSFQGSLLQAFRSIVERCVQMVSLIVCEKNEGRLGSARFFPFKFSPALLLSKRMEQAIFREALLTDTLVSGQLYLRTVIFKEL